MIWEILFWLLITSLTLGIIAIISAAKVSGSISQMERDEELKQWLEKNGDN